MTRADLWTPEDEQELARLWDLGFTGSQIGARLGKTRNAIIGKVNRMKINRNARPSPPIPIEGRNGTPWTEEELASLRQMRADGTIMAVIAKKLSRSFNSVKRKCESLQIRAPRAAYSPQRTVERIVARIETPCEVIPLERLQWDSCRFPFGDPGAADFGFCGHIVDRPGLPYCKNHHALAYVRGSSMREKNRHGKSY